MAADIVTLFQIMWVAVTEANCPNRFPFLNIRYLRFGGSDNYRSLNMFNNWDYSSDSSCTFWRMCLQYYTQLVSRIIAEVDKVWAGFVDNGNVRNLGIIILYDKISCIRVNVSLLTLLYLLMESLIWNLLALIVSWELKLPLIGAYLVGPSHFLVIRRSDVGYNSNNFLETDQAALLRRKGALNFAHVMQVNNSCQSQTFRFAWCGFVTPYKCIFHQPILEAWLHGQPRHLPKEYTNVILLRAYIDEY